MHIFPSFLSCLVSDELIPNYPSVYLWNRASFHKIVVAFSILTQRLQCSDRTLLLAVLLSWRIGNSPVHLLANTVSVVRIGESQVVQMKEESPSPGLEILFVLFRSHVVIRYPQQGGRVFK